MSLYGAPWMAYDSGAVNPTGGTMQITRQADYAVRAVLYLAQQSPGTLTTTAQIARDQHIPATFLAKIMSQLSAAGLVYSTRGAHGGVRLARQAMDVSLLDVVEAIDGPMVLNECVSDPTACPLGPDCAAHDVWCQAQADLVARLSRTRFAQILAPRGAA
jgi:Rrf2 family protein